MTWIRIELISWRACTAAVIATTNQKALTKGNVLAVLSATAVQTHMARATEFLEAGKDVFMEKRLADSIESGEVMVG